MKTKDLAWACDLKISKIYTIGFASLAALVVLQIGCSTATKYGPMSESDAGGYQDQKLDEGVYHVRVAANAQTSRKITDEYLIRRAGELCQTDGYSYWDISDYKDHTQVNVQHITQTYVTPTKTTGSFQSGPYSGYGQYSSRGSAGFQAVSTGGNSTTSSYDQQFVFPDVDAVGICYKKAKVPALGVRFQQLTSDEATNFGISDKLPALQVLNIPASVETQLQVGDVIVKVNNKRIIDIANIVVVLRNFNKGSIVLTVLRDGKPQELNVPINERAPAFGPQNLRQLASE